MKRSWKYAVAGVVGSAAGVAVYLWGKNHKETEEKNAFSIEVDDVVPDYLVNEARDAGRFVVETVSKDCTAKVVDVIEFSTIRVYGVELDEDTVYVYIDDDGTKEMEHVSISVGECACCEG